MLRVLVGANTPEIGDFFGLQLIQLILVDFCLASVVKCGLIQFINLVFVTSVVKRSAAVFICGAQCLKVFQN